MFIPQQSGWVPWIGHTGRCSLFFAQVTEVFSVGFPSGFLRSYKTNIYGRRGLYTSLYVYIFEYFNYSTCIIFWRNWFLIFLLQTSPPAGTNHYSASRTVLLNTTKMLNVEFTIIYHGRDPFLDQSPCFLWFKRWLMLKMVKAGGSITIPRRIEGRFRRIVPHGPAPLHWHHPHLTWSLGAGMLKRWESKEI